MTYVAEQMDDASKLIISLPPAARIFSTVLVIFQTQKTSGFTREPRRRTSFGHFGTAFQSIFRRSDPRQPSNRLPMISAIMENTPSAASPTTLAADDAASAAAPPTLPTPAEP